MSTEIQSLKPLNVVVLSEMPEQGTKEQGTNVVNLDLCQWRYSKNVIDKFNDYQTSIGKKCKMPYRWTQWQTSDNILN